jgi:hypothetical protein
MGWQVSEFAQLPIAKLTGRALDWAVLVALGWQPDRPQDGQLRIGNHDLAASVHSRVHLPRYNATHSVCVVGSSSEPWFISPSSSWEHGGPLIDKYKIWLTAPADCIQLTEWAAAIDVTGQTQLGATALEAICRAVAAHHNPTGTARIPCRLIEVQP